MKKIIILLLILVPVYFAAAQSEVDALRYSQTYFGASARSMGMAGAFGSVGADMSTLSSNPAGIGLYKRTEMTLTPLLHEGTTNSSFLGNSEETSNYNFDLQNAGAVFTFQSRDKRSEWSHFQFGIGVNRLRDFNNEMRIAGNNSSANGTIMKPFADYASEYGTIEGLENNAAFDALLAYEADLLYDVDGDPDNGYQWGYDAIYGGVFQQKNVKTSGSLDEVFISFGGNYQDKLYMGASLGIQSIDYSEYSTYYEVDAADTIPVFNSLTKYDKLETTGSGINLKLGAIYRLNEWLRVGLAYHTPTFYGSMRDVYSSEMEASLTYDEQEGAVSNQSERSAGEFDYELITPSRVIGSATALVSQYGLISVDYEMVNYSTASLDSDNFDFATSNTYISREFKRQNNLRLGTEWRYESFYFRGGYAIYGSPYKNSGDFGETTFQTFGLGYRDGSFSIDFAYVNAERSDTYYIYDKNYVEAAVNDYKQDQYVLTVGFQF